MDIEPVTITIPNEVADKELRAIAYIGLLLSELEPIERGRILDYLRRRYHPQNS